MVSVAEARGPNYFSKDSEGGQKILIGKLFSDSEIDRTSQIVKALEGLSIWEAKDLLSRIDCYLEQSLFVPNV